MKAAKVKLQPRDLALMRGLYESRIFSLKHAAQLYFDGRYQVAKRRIILLRNHGYLKSKARRQYEELLIFLSAKGFQELIEQKALEGLPILEPKTLKRRLQVSDLTLSHELAVMDCKTAFVSKAIDLPNPSFTEFTTWPRLCAFKAPRPVDIRGTWANRNTFLSPDGFFRLTLNSKFQVNCFLELDQSTELRRTILSKSIGYIHFYKTGGLAKRLGVSAERFKEFPFRVLVVVKNEERRNNLLEQHIQCSDAGSLSHRMGMIWMTTIDELKNDPYGVIWATPKHYREALLGSPYDPTITQETKAYIRRPERELFVSKRLELQPLIDLQKLVLK